MLTDTVSLVFNRLMHLVHEMRGTRSSLSESNIHWVVGLLLQEIQNRMLHMFFWFVFRRRLSYIFIVITAYLSR